MRNQTFDGQKQERFTRKYGGRRNTGGIMRNRSRAMMMIDMADRSLGRLLALIGITAFGSVAVEIDKFHGMATCSSIGKRRNADAAKHQHQDHEEGGQGFGHHRAVNTARIGEQSICRSCILYLPLQLFGNLHWHECADTRASRVADGKASGEIAQRRKCEPHELTECFASVSKRNCIAQHFEVCADVRPEGRLREDMQPFERAPCGFAIMSCTRVPKSVQFTLDQFIHGHCEHRSNQARRCGIVRQFGTGLPNNLPAPTDPEARHDQCYQQVRQAAAGPQHGHARADYEAIVDRVVA